MSDAEPIVPFRPRDPGARPETTEARNWAAPQPPRVAFDRKELGLILAAYGAKVAQGEWRDYAIGMGRETAVFAVFRHSTEMPLYRIEKHPKLRNKQGMYCVVASGGLIMKRGHELAQVLRVLEPKRPQLVE